MTEHIKINEKYLYTAEGLTENELFSLSTKTSEALLHLKNITENNEIGFLNLPFNKSDINTVKKLASEVSESVKNIVILGIGGSSLGPQALYSALKPPFYHLNTENKRLFFPDNVDPLTMSALLDFLKLEETLFLVITKSGGTAETASQFMIVWQKLVEYFGENKAKKHLVAVTDPKKGNLRTLATELSLKTAPIPSNVGGRFSVLSPVGLLPAALVGIDIDALLEGAAYMSETLLKTDPNKVFEHPALKLATIYYALHTNHSKNIHVMMPYADSLFPIALWFNQLWGESLGKRKNLEGQDVFTGPTPVAARGTTDQHSQLQLYAEGPSDKIVTFLTVKQLASELPIPKVFTHIDSYSYLGGHTMNKLLETEQQATALALFQNGRPSVNLVLPAITPEIIGEFFMMFQIATAISGSLYNINPFDQPGVELGKQYTYGALGRPGFEAEGKIMKNELK